MIGAECTPIGSDLASSTIYDGLVANTLLKHKE